MANATPPPSNERELKLPNKLDEAYQTHRKETDLREPYKLPDEILKGAKKNLVKYDVAESPMIAFINARSGGRMGAGLLDALYRALGNAQVYDVLDDKPDRVLQKIWQNLDDMEKEEVQKAREIKQRLKVVACGGDGTVAWVMKVIKDLKLDPPPAVAIIPLGTGNDLSRSFKWGKTFKKKWIANNNNTYHHLKKISDGVYRNLDCWNIHIAAPEKGYYDDLPHSLTIADDAQLTASGCAWNYISFGMDAQSAYGFHNLREDHPFLASGRLVNQFWYSFFGLKSGWFCCCNSLNPPVNRSLKLTILDKENQWKEITLPNNIKALVIVNLQSYAGGRNIWGTARLTAKEKQKSMVEPKLDDSLFEVVGFRTGWHTGMVMGGVTHCVRLAQSKSAEIQLRCSKTDPAGEHDFIYMQIDGEPWKQKIPSIEKSQLTVRITHNGYSSLLMNEENTQTRNLDHTAATSSAPGRSNVPLVPQATSQVNAESV